MPTTVSILTRVEAPFPPSVSIFVSLHEKTCAAAKVPWPSPGSSSDAEPSVAVLRLLHLFQRHKEGKRELSWFKVDLSREDYAQLLAALDRCESLRRYVENELRYDYDSYKQELVIRIPSAVHEIFIRKVDRDIMSQLDAIGNDVEIAREIESIGSTDLELGESKHCPDSAYKCNGSQYPHLVVEVSYSQKRHDLPYLADDYVVDSNGSIGVVIGLNIEYKGTKKAML